MTPLRNTLGSWFLIAASLSASTASAQTAPAVVPEAAGDEANGSDAASDAAATDGGDSADQPEPVQTPAEEEQTPAPATAATDEGEPPPPTYGDEDSSSVSETGEIQIPELPRPKRPSPFDQGTFSVGVGLGMASSSTEDWMILGLGVGYFVVDGLQVQLDSTYWVIGYPFLATVTPGVRYVLHFVPKVKPYIGGYYRHYFVGNDNEDTNSIGARLGVNFMTGRMSYFGAGMVYEHFLDTKFFRDQDQFYPEITFAFSF